MNTLVPIELYSNIYYYAIMLIVIISFIQSTHVSLEDESNIWRKKITGVILLWTIIFYIGLRPVNYYYFGDMGVYAAEFQQLAKGVRVDETKHDVTFAYFMKICSDFMTVDGFFLSCTLLYILPLYFAVRRMFPQYWFYAFMMLVVSMSFWTYGTNGIRNGMATSFFVLAITRKNKINMFIWMLLAVSFHKSLLIPISAFVISAFYTKSQSYLKVWVIAIILSLALGSFWENFFMNMGLIEDDRITGYLNGNTEFAEQFSSTGFRWDFLLYSFSGVFAGWYFIIKRGFQDKLYIWIYNTYLIANAFWILVIQAAFSNRFAYLSWFLLGVVIIYPLLVEKFFERQHLVIARILAVYFFFTFLLNVILVKW